MRKCDARCKKEGHRKGSYPKKAFCDICQVLGHSTKECPYNMKTRGNQVLFTQEQSSPSGTVGTSQPQANTTASSSGYKGNRRGGRGNNNNNNNRSRMQYDAKGRPMIWCRACNQWGHFTQDCQKEETPQNLCRWCSLGDHDDTNCPSQGLIFSILRKLVIKKYWKSPVLRPRRPLIPTPVRRRDYRRQRLTLSGR